MGHTVTLGGDRLGSGNKNKIALHNYERSTHNLSRKFTSSMQCGTLYPFLCMPAMRGDKFDINLAADARTIPTKGPLFGSFKMQVDLFQCDVRLYQAILHNNPLAIGLKMNQVRFPILSIQEGKYGVAFSNSSLMKYLGLSGIGINKTSADNFQRGINAIPALAYYEIFKTYYANKQEENAYVIGTEIIEGHVDNFDYGKARFLSTGNEVNLDFENSISLQTNGGLPVDIIIEPNNEPQGYEENIYLDFYKTTSELVGGYSFKSLLEMNSSQDFGSNAKVMTKLGTNIYRLNSLPNLLTNYQTITRICLTYRSNTTYFYKQRGLEPFALANIDDMRLKLLSFHTLGQAFNISPDTDSANNWGYNSGTDQSGMPYIKLVDLFAPDDGTQETYTLNATPLNGLCVKTYQSDLFNNWVNTEWIDGENGIAAVTSISTSDGSFTIDSLNFAEKLYNMLNRIAVSDGSYEGWQDAVYTETPKRHIESPIYLGGMSSEIVFEEIVQSAPAEGNPLGTLGGKGKLLKRKGGHVTVKTNEAAFIIGIVSLTPRVNYSQGNEFYLTDLLSMDDFHKPALDGIGFQNLIGERMAWFDTHNTNSGWERSTVGKVPAWIEYMTAVDKTYGDFAETGGRGFMALNREYERDGSDNIKDATTYIDPRKYNYAFAVTDIDAQNFWVQIQADIKARRLMSAKQIPNI